MFDKQLRIPCADGTCCCRDCVPIVGHMRQNLTHPGRCGETSLVRSVGTRKVNEVCWRVCATKVQQTRRTAQAHELPLISTGRNKVVGVSRMNVLSYGSKFFSHNNASCD